MRSVGAVIEAELARRGWTLSQLSAKMGGIPLEDKHFVKALIACSDLVLDVETARGLARAFNTTPEFWLKIDADWHAVSRPEEEELRQWTEALRRLIADWEDRAAHGFPGTFQQASADLREVYERLTGAESR